MAQETFNTQFNFQGFNTLKKDLREATELYQKMLASGKATTAELELQAQKVAKLKDKIDDANDATRALTGAGRIQAFGRAITAVSGGFTALQGAIALSGVESEELQKTMVKLQAAMALTQGLSQLEDFGNAMKNAARATGLQTVAMRLYTFVTNGANLATKAFRATLVSLGAGAIIVGLGLLVQKLTEMATAGSKAAEEAEKAKEKAQELADLRLKTAQKNQTIEQKITDNTVAQLETIITTRKKLGQFDLVFGDQLVGSLTLSDKNKDDLEDTLIDIDNFLKERKNKEATLDRQTLIAKKGRLATSLSLSKEEKELLEAEIRELELNLGEIEDRYISHYNKLKEAFQKRQETKDKIAQKGKDQEKKDQEQSKKVFQDELRDYIDSQNERIAKENEFNSIFIRLVSAKAKTEEEIQLEQFQNGRKLREKAIKDEMETAKGAIALLKKRNEEGKNVSAEERAENEKQIKEYNDRILTLEKNLNFEKAASDAEYAQLVKELADQRLAKEKETNDALIEEQKRLRDEFEKNLKDQLSVIDEFYERKKRAAFTGLENQRDFDKRERKIEMEKLKRQIRLLEFFGQSTEEQEFRLRALKKETADEEVRIRVEAANAVLAIGEASFQGLLDLDNIRLQNVLRNENISNVEKERVAKESFERQKALNKAMAIMDAAKTVSSIYAQWPKWDGGFMMYAALALAAIQLGVAFAKINEAQYVSPVTSGTGQSVNLSSKFAMGGMLIGPSHSQGGIKTAMGELEGGEFVVNRIASQAFLPILEKINSVGQSHSERMMTNQNQQTPIIKTYVVATDMDSALEKKRKIEKLARL